MKNKKIQDIKISLKIMDSVSKQELAKESKGLTILSFEMNLKDDDLLTSCYLNASAISSESEGSGIPFLEDIGLIFINHCIGSATAKAEIFIATPDGTYPLIEINKKLIDSIHPEITIQRIEKHLQLHANQNYELIIDRIEDWLNEKKMFFALDGGHLANKPITEVW